MPTLLLASGGAALCVAIARPVEKDLVPRTSEALDIVLVIDVSSSMNQQDERGVRRIEVARDRAIEFVESREGDRISLIAFAAYPDLRCPPTRDRRALQAFLNPLETVRDDSAEDGTGYGAALAEAVELLAGSESKSRVVLLLTAGEENVNEIPPRDAAEFANESGVRVHAIGFGAPVQTILGLREPDFTLLTDVAETTGGEFFRARSSEELGAVYETIDQLEKSEVEDPIYRVSEWYETPRWIASGLLTLGLLLESLWLRRSPA